MENLDELKASAEQGNPKAQYKLASYYEGMEEEKLAFHWYYTAAKQGYPDAEYEVGECYALGLGVEESWENAYTWYLKAAQKGHRRAQWDVAECLMSGVGIKQDEAEALNWYKKSALNGYAPAQIYLGVEEDENQNYEEAYRWYSMASKQGDAIGHYNLGCLYLDGLGVEKDYTKAFELFSMATEKDEYLVSAITNLGYCYENGYGTEKNMKLANEFYLKAANGKNAVAAFNLAESYELGKAMEQDIPTALKWYKISAELGDKEALKKVKELEKNDR